MEKYLVALTNQGESRIDVHDLSLGNISAETAVWSHEYRDKAIAGVKLRRYKGRLVVIAAHGHMNASMVDYETHEELWHTDYTGANPHSIELIPFDDGKYLIAVAASVGFDVKFFDPTAGRIPSVGCMYAPDGHGVLYDPDNKCLWVLSEDLLTKNEIIWDGVEAKAVRIATYKAPSAQGHDMAPVYGDKNRIWVTFNRIVYQFDKTTGEFCTDYEAYDEINTPERVATRSHDSQIKGIGNFPDGSCVKIYPDAVYYPWTTNTVRFIKKNPDGSFTKTALASPTGHYYKVRVFCEDYN